MTLHKLLKAGKLTALISFAVGTAIFLLYYFTDAYLLLFLGYAFIAIAGLVNILIFLKLLLEFRKQNCNKKNIITTCGLMLVNLPIMLLYCWVTLILLNTMRITFSNESANRITDLKISGCENKVIEKLDAQESKLVWVGIQGDCSITIEFLSNGKIQTESVAGYITNNMGHKMTYKIHQINAY